MHDLKDAIKHVQERQNLFRELARKAKGKKLRSIYEAKANELWDVKVNFILWYQEDDRLGNGG